MALIKKPFVKYDDEGKEKPDIFSVRIDVDWRKRFDEDKKLLQQPKDSTAIKTLAEIGSLVLHDHLQSKIVKLIFKNKSNNERSGNAEFE